VEAAAARTLAAAEVGTLAAAVDTLAVAVRILAADDRGAVSISVAAAVILAEACTMVAVDGRILAARRILPDVQVVVRAARSASLVRAELGAAPTSAPRARAHLRIAGRDFLILAADTHRSIGRLRRRVLAVADASGT
jgi:hypothetical protein